MATTSTGCAATPLSSWRADARPTAAGICARSRPSWENAPTLREIIRLTYTLVDIWCQSYLKPPQSVVLDIDDTVDVVHGHQQLAQWNAHYDERCSLQGNDAEHIYQTIYCARVRAENLIKQHKAQLSSDRTSCRSPLANQMRLILHTGAYWLLLDLRAAIPNWNPLRHTEFATIRLRLLKVTGRVIESATRIRIALASCCPEAETFSLIALKLQPSGP